MCIAFSAVFGKIVWVAFWEVQSIMLLKFMGHRAVMSIYILSPEDSHSDDMLTEKVLTPI
jgi:hypothetical protein